MNMESLLRRGIKIFAFITAMNFLSYALIGLLVYKFVYVDFFKEQATKEEAILLTEQYRVVKNIEKAYQNILGTEVVSFNEDINTSPASLFSMCAFDDSELITSISRNPNIISNNKLESEITNEQFFDYVTEKGLLKGGNGCSDMAYKTLSKNGNILAFRLSLKNYTTTGMFGNYLKLNKFDEKMITPINRFADSNFYRDTVTGNIISMDKSYVVIYYSQYIDEIENEIRITDLKDARKDVIKNSFKSVEDNTAYVIKAILDNKNIDGRKIVETNKEKIIDEFRTFLTEHYGKRGYKHIDVGFYKKTGFESDTRIRLGFKLDKEGSYTQNTSFMNEDEEIINKLEHYFEKGRKIQIGEQLLNRLY